MAVHRVPPQRRSIDQMRDQTGVDVRREDLDELNQSRGGCAFLSGCGVTGDVRQADLSLGRHQSSQEVVLISLPRRNLAGAAVEAAHVEAASNIGDGKSAFMQPRQVDDLERKRRGQAQRRNHHAVRERLADVLGQVTERRSNELLHDWIRQRRFGQIVELDALEHAQYPKKVPLVVVVSRHDVRGNRASKKAHPFLETQRSGGKVAGVGDERTNRRDEPCRAVRAVERDVVWTVLTPASRVHDRAVRWRRRRSVVRRQRRNLVLPRHEQAKGEP